jgi:hypothetical protein
MSQINIFFEIILEELTKTDDVFLNHLISLVKDKKYTELEAFLAKERKDINLTYGAEINILCYAVMKKDIQAIELLIDAGANVNFHNETTQEIEKMYPILSHASFGHPNVLNYLFQKGLNANNATGEQSLYFALKNNRVENSTLLLKNKASYENIDWSEINPNIKALVQPIIDDFDMQKAIKKEKEDFEHIFFEKNLSSKHNKL